MNTLLPEILIILDLVGFGLTLWLGLHLMTHGWGWHPTRVRPAALTLWSLSLVFALGVYDGLSPISGASIEGALLRLLLWPLPLAWLLFMRRLSLSATYRLLKWLVLLLALGTLATSLLTGLLRPEYLSYSWVYLPAYIMTLLLATFISVLLTLRSRGIVITVLERRALTWLIGSSLLAFIGGSILATDFVLGLESSLLRPLTVWILPEELRLVGTLNLLLAGFALSQGILSRARAEGASHLSSYRHSFLVTLVMTGLYMAVGGAAVWLWDLPWTLLGVFLLLALLTDLLGSATRGQLERWLYRGETGRLRHELRHIADRLEAPHQVPTAVRSVLSQLSRQLNISQLGVAFYEEKEKVYRVAVALRSTWEGETVDVRDPTIWEERNVGGWNMPLKTKDGKTIGIIVSDKSDVLNPVQQQLLEDAAAKIAQLLEEWQELTNKRVLLRKAVDEYRQHAEALDSKSAVLGAPILTRHTYLRAVERALERYNEPIGLEQSALTGLQVTKRLAGSAASGSTRATVLRELLSQLVEQLRPYEGEPIGAAPSPEWHPYLILRSVYLEGESRHKWMGQLQLNERAFNRASRAGMAQVAHVLADLEVGVMRLPTEQEEQSSLSGLPVPNANAHSVRDRSTSTTTPTASVLSTPAWSSTTSPSHPAFGTKSFAPLSSPSSSTKSGSIPGSTKGGASTNDARDSESKAKRAATQSKSKQLSHLARRFLPTALTTDSKRMKSDQSLFSGKVLHEDGDNVNGEMHENGRPEGVRTVVEGSKQDTQKEEDGEGKGL